MHIPILGGATVCRIIAQCRIRFNSLIDFPVILKVVILRAHPKYIIKNKNREIFVNIIFLKLTFIFPNPGVFRRARSSTSQLE